MPTHLFYEENISPLRLKTETHLAIKARCETTFDIEGKPHGVFSISEPDEFTREQGLLFGAVFVSAGDHITYIKHYEGVAEGDVLLLTVGGFPRLICINGVLLGTHVPEKRKPRRAPQRSGKRVVVRRKPAKKLSKDRRKAKSGSHHMAKMWRAARKRAERDGISVRDARKAIAKEVAAEA